MKLKNPYLSFPRISLALTLLLCLPLIWKLYGFKVSSETRVFLEADQRNYASFEKVEEILSGVDMIVISLECPEVFSTKGVDLINRIGEAFLRCPWVFDVKSVTHSSKPVRQGMGFEMVPFVSTNVSTEELARVKKYSLEHPLVRNVMVASDSRHALISIATKEKAVTDKQQAELARNIQAVLAPFKAEGYHFELIGFPLVEEEIRTTLRQDMLFCIPMVVLVVGVILWLTFRSWKVFFMVLLNQAALVVLLPGIMEMSGFRINIFSTMLFPMLMGIQLTLLAHLYTSFQRACREGAESQTALEQALKIVVQPAAFATITTIVGLLSLLCTEVRQVREFGIIGAMGLCGVHFLTFGPGLALLKIVFEHHSLRGDNMNVQHGTADTKNGLVAGMALISQKYRRSIFAVCWIIAGLTIIGFLRIRTDIRAAEFLSPKSPSRKTIETMDRIYGGINVVQIEFDSGKTNGVNNIEFLKYLDQVHRFASSQTNFSGVYSYSQLLAMMNQIWEREKEGSLRLPDQPLLINLFVMALRTQNYPFLTALADSTFRKGYLILRTQDMPTQKYLSLVDGVVDYAKKMKPAGVEVSAAQGIHSILEADRRIIRSQISSAGLTAGVIGLILALLWRSVRLSLLCLLANAIPVAFVVASAGLFGTPLNSITIMVAAISLGIAVDNSIHFITFWRREFQANGDRIAAVENTLKVKGLPIMWTSLILIVIFAVFWFSSFPPIVHFGLLSSIAFMGALASVILLLPAMLAK